MSIITCGNDVFRWKKQEVRRAVANPKKYMVGCTRCARVCPDDPITFPTDAKTFLRRVVIVHKIFPAVTEELDARLCKFPNHVIDSTKEGVTEDVDTP